MPALVLSERIRHNKISSKGEIVNAATNRGPEEAYS
jgi:hypothetical protein